MLWLWWLLPLITLLFSSNFPGSCHRSKAARQPTLKPETLEVLGGQLKPQIPFVYVCKLYKWDMTRSLTDSRTTANWPDTHVHCIYCLVAICVALSYSWNCVKSNWLQLPCVVCRRAVVVETVKMSDLGPMSVLILPCSDWNSASEIFCTAVGERNKVSASWIPVVE